MTLIGSITSTIRRAPAEWKAPAIDGPMIIDENELTPLGEVGGHAWFSHDRGDFRERPGTLTDDDILPDRYLVMTLVDGQRTYRTFDVFEHGAYGAALTAPAHRSYAQRAVRMQPVDALDGISILESSGWKARGPEAILARLAAKGHPITLATDSGSLVTSADRGHLRPGVSDVLAVAAPLLLAHLQGAPLPCRVTTHKKPTPAATIALGGAPWCGECQP